MEVYSFVFSEQHAMYLVKDDKTEENEDTQGGHATIQRPCH